MASVYNTYQNSSLGMMETSNPNHNYYQGQQARGYPYHNQNAAVNMSYGYAYNNGGAAVAAAAAAAPAAAPVYYGQPQAQAQAQQQPAAEPQVTGGVSSVLDYDLDIMSKFTTYLAFRLFDRKDTGNTQFVASLKSVLSSVRLPLSSLILSNYFLLEKFELDSTLFQAHGNELEKIYEFIVISLILANKANDDNTFTNKSWSCATGLPIQAINKTEVQWLGAMGYRLHNTKMERYNELMLQFEKYTTSVKNHEMEQMALMEAKARQLQAQAQSVQHSINPVYYRPYAYSNTRESQPKNGSLSIGNGYSRENFYSHRKNYSIDQSTVGSQYYGQAQTPSSSSNAASTTTASPYYNSYCLKSGSYQVDAYCSCSYCLAGSSSNAYSNGGSNMNWRQHYYNNKDVSC
ncbi:hypothetical protein WICPIJ_006677 [Wickerhamomyces pijperi]|uniref:Cyclin N-terminal domain-containing protein n=1 Tax=Wickerhamomyces pijperi TaxID=599730 RepID=A0A9P8Q199_WICPI|nr:hypothetical protein WICPIJ_006677 [Wickerhamomyces pijperi]